MSRLTPQARQMLQALDEATLAVVLYMVKSAFIPKKERRAYPDRLVYSAAQLRGLQRARERMRSFIEKAR